jgi:hypothetical protein
MFQMTFTKEVLSNFVLPEFESAVDCNVYKLYNNQVLSGQLLITRKVCYFKTATNTYRIDIHDYFFKSSEFEIYNLETNLKIGSFVLPSFLASSNEIGTLVILDKQFICKRENPNIRSSIFKKDTWGYYKLSMSNTMSRTEYNFRIPTRWIEPSGSEFRNIEGDIITTHHEVEIIIAGFFAVERMLFVSDSNNL